MKKIRNILFALPLAFTFVFLSCSDSDDFAQATAAISDVDKLVGDKNYITMPIALHEEDWEGNEMPSSKASLYYNYATGGVKFTWKELDEVGVYPVKHLVEGMQQTYEPEKSTLGKWIIYSVKNTDNTSVGVFDPDDEHISGHPQESYIAVYPYIDDDVDYRDIPITYEGQKQNVSSKINLYLKRNIGDNLNDYIQSEKDACAHLSKFDYLVDTEREASEMGNKIRFNMSRLGAEIRFFMKVPEKIVFDSLQLYNPTKKFVHTTTLNGATGEYAAIPTKESHVTSLQLGDFGFDYYKSVTGDDYYYNPTIGWVMTAYMMIAPIDLSAEETENSMLYLIGREPLYYTSVTDYNNDHSEGNKIGEEAFNALTAEQKIKLYTNKDDYNKDNNKNLTAEQFAALTDDAKMMVYADVDAFNAAKGTSLTAEQFAALTPAQKMTRHTKRYYKALNLAKKDIKKAYLYQWTVANAAEDAPITFEEISIQEWEEGPGFTNEEGNGTEEW